MYTYANIKILWPLKFFSIIKIVHAYERKLSETEKQK